MYSFLSSASKNGFSAENSYNKLLDEFQKGNITYPRTDGITHSPITIISSNINPQIKQILNTYPNFKEINNTYVGDIYTLCGVLHLTTPGSIIKDLKKANQIQNFDKTTTDLYIGLKRKHFIEEEELLIELSKKK